MSQPKKMIAKDYAIRNIRNPSNVQSALLAPPPPLSPRMHPKGAHPNFSSNRFSIFGSPLAPSDPSLPLTPQKLGFLYKKSLDQYQPSDLSSGYLVITTFSQNYKTKPPVWLQLIFQKFYC